MPPLHVCVYVRPVTSLSEWGTDPDLEPQVQSHLCTSEQVSASIRGRQPQRPREALRGLPVLCDAQDSARVSGAHLGICVCPLPSTEGQESSMSRTDVFYINFLLLHSEQ